MNPSILAHRQKIDNLFKKVASFTEPEIQSEWSKYLCILVSGFIEESLRVLLEKYCENKASPNIQKFVTKQIQDITNCKTSRITEILGKFSLIWESEFTNKIQEKSKIDGEIKTAIDSVIINRHKIAHGKSIGMSYQNISNYYNNVKKAVEILEEIIK
ncbi:HEPN domain-containing protein [Anabaena sp. PCC 7108]|uniref:HEPN domain-containing protein n=1 Tax=Anabaena sp. PCC 7108 TaxID=163908 RepID=UPI00037C9F78|nr:HEPN domain-containing protein [Anabaena sp. PCC 7108]